MSADAIGRVKAVMATQIRAPRVKDPITRTTAVNHVSFDPADLVAAIDAIPAAQQCPEVCKALRDGAAEQLRRKKDQCFIAVDHAFHVLDKLPADAAMPGAGPSVVSGQ